MESTPARLLIVDDEPSITEFISQALTQEGYKADTADHGEEALALVECNDYDLFILDIMLPGMDGYELCRRIRAKAGGPSSSCPRAIPRSTRWWASNWAPTTI